MSDIQEAKQQVTGVEKGGFAWGIRQAIWGKRGETGTGSSSSGEAVTVSEDAKNGR